MAPKVAWTSAEDALLHQLVEQHGDHPQWGSVIASEWMPIRARTSKQIRER